MAGTFECEPVSFSRRTVLHGVSKYIRLCIHTNILYINLYISRVKNSNLISSVIRILFGYVLDSYGTENLSLA